ncbi:hypothetical protein [Paenibacillus cremeus]|uniref:Glycosyltransferase family 2 protein n=1 Tax=Paenibacillus cremeus TaxID=2163881 RepID=A0A559KID6_9BACL|nr:hypothetical protein [Paenibacillus cremeus]TVY11828.1 hypothetical protein FPZ49_00600 [Paenibacillus cremeus]
MIFCTMAGKEQLAHAVVLAKSVKAHHPGAQMHLCLVESHIPAEKTQDFDEIVLVTNQGAAVGSPDSFCAARAFFIRHLLHAGYDKLIYLDPETNVYSSLNEIEELLNHHEIIACPYHLEPCHWDDFKPEIECLRNGFLHAGFLALRNSDHSRRFASWWCERIEASFFGPEKDAMAGHKWLSLAMVPFQIYLLKNPAYHIAAWNLRATGRSIAWGTEGGYAVDGVSLKTFCFSNPNGLLDHNASLFLSDPSSAGHALIQSYKRELEAVR